MLTIKVPAVERWDPINEQFINSEETILKMEHSLSSISKWESKWGKSFFDSKERTIDELISYIEFMTLNEITDPFVFKNLTADNIDEIVKYIESPNSATFFSDSSANSKPSRTKITSEIIYYWMSILQIPFEAESWPLNRLYNLIRIHAIKNGKKEKRSQKDIIMRNRELNAQRKKKYNTKG